MLNKSVVIFACFFGNDNNDEKTNDHQRNQKKTREHTMYRQEKKRATTITM